MTTPPGFVVVWVSRAEVDTMIRTSRWFVNQPVDEIVDNLWSRYLSNDEVT